jgi:hypothetical protein
MSRVLWTIKGWREVLQQLRKHHEPVFADSGGWTEAQWQAAYELSREGFARMMAELPDLIVFNESELTFAAIGICDFFGVDRDNDSCCEEVFRILRSEGRLLQ